jgi:hypothetical protein
MPIGRGRARSRYNPAYRRRLRPRVAQEPVDVQPPEPQQLLPNQPLQLQPLIPMNEPVQPNINHVIKIPFFYFVPLLINISYSL